jgi:hypothetical protein
VVIAIQLIFCHVVDDHDLAALPDFIADGGFNLQLAAGLQAERDMIQHIAGNPPVFGYPRNSRKTHPRAAANHFQHGFHTRNPLDSVDVRLKALQVDLVFDCHGELILVLKNHKVDRRRPAGGSGWQAQSGGLRYAHALFLLQSGRADDP